MPQKTLDDTSYDPALMPTNPLLPYVQDQSWISCNSEREVHGRPMFEPDTTNTLDNGSDSDALNFHGFDIVGVGRNVSSNPNQAKSTNMYIVLKVEVGPF